MDTCYAREDSHGTNSLFLGFPDLVQRHFDREQPFAHAKGAGAESRAVSFSLEARQVSLDLGLAGKRTKPGEQADW